VSLKKKVLITGASRGIGKSILEAFSDGNSFLIGTATSEVGLDTIQNFLSENKIEGKALILDLGKEVSINNFFTTLKDNDLYPDVLINNAGITRDNIFLRMKDEEWSEVLDIHLNSQFKIIKK
jgi:3-oxoacyl-[acyl-carrier protein] reductase